MRRLTTLLVLCGALSASAQQPKMPPPPPSLPPPEGAPRTPALERLVEGRGDIVRVITGYDSLDGIAWRPADGLTFTPWPHASMPGFSLPALEAAKCVAKQGDEMFERVHLALFRAYFTESRNIGDVDEVARIVQQAAPDVDMARFASLLGA